MVAIDVDFEVFKAITARRESEHVTANHVLRKLLQLPEPKSTPKPPLPPGPAAGLSAKDVFLPNGARLVKVYKGEPYVAEIRKGRIHVIGIEGESFLSPSAAAVAVTKQPTNGWVFWKVLLPGAMKAVSLNELRK